MGQLLPSSRKPDNCKTLFCSPSLWLRLFWNLIWASGRAEMFIGTFRKFLEQRGQTVDETISSMRSIEQREILVITSKRTLSKIFVVNDNSFYNNSHHLSEMSLLLPHLFVLKVHPSCCEHWSGLIFYTNLM